MANRIVPAGATSQMLDIFLQDSSSTTGAGLASLAYNTSSLTCYYHRDSASGSTSVSLATMTLGTYTSGGFKEVDGTNMPGMYQFCPPDAALAAGAKEVTFYFKGATNLAQTPYKIQITNANLDDSVHLGCTALPNAVAGASSGLVINGTNSGTVNLAALTVTGACSFGSTFGVAGAFSLQSTATITGACSFGSTLSVAGAVALQSTLGVTGTTTFAAVTTTGTVTANALTVTNATTLSGAVSLGSTLGVTGTTTLTGAVTMTNGLTANITGNLVGTVSTVTTLTGHTPQTGDNYAVVTNGTYGLSALKTLIDAIQSTANTLSSKLGAFTGATTNSVYGFLLAMMKKDVTAPSTVGGTYDPSTDSLEAIQEQGAAILDDTGTSGVVVASDSKTGYTLASAGLDSVVIETGLNARQSLSIIAAACGGVLAGAATTTNTIKGAGVATTRITATVDSDGNRSAITLNPPT